MIDNKTFCEMDGHKLLMPEEKSDVGIRSVMKAYSAYSNLEDVWEIHTTKLVKEVLKEGQVAVDIGASIGYFTLLFARQVGKTGKVISFEPTPNQFPYLLENIKNNGYEDRVLPFNLAAWDKKEDVKMPPINKNFDCKADIVDDVLDREGINKVDFMKIDVDGSEPQVLKGLLRTFENNKNLKMIFEYYPKYIRKLNGSPTEVMTIIDKYFNHSVIQGDYGMGLWNLFCQHK